MTDSHDGVEPPAYPPPGYPPSDYPPPGYVPPPGYAPPAYPTSDFQVPFYPMPGFGPLDPTAYDTDPLVAGPVEPFRGWWLRLVATVRRSGPALVPIVVILYTVPQIVLGGVEAYLAHARADAGGAVGAGLALIEFGSVLLTFAALYLVAVGWCAAQWTLVRHAVNAPAPLGDALRFGFRSGVRVWGWILLYSIMVVAGFCALVLPGIYLAIAGGLVIPTAIFQRGTRAISASFTLVNRQFFAAAGRLLLAYLPTLVAIVIAGLVSLGGLSLEGARLVLEPSSDLVTSIISGVLDIPAEIILVAGVLLTYGQLRARIMPTTSADLAAAL